MASTSLVDFPVGPSQRVSPQHPVRKGAYLVYKRFADDAVYQTLQPLESVGCGYILLPVRRAQIPLQEEVPQSSEGRSVMCACYHLKGNIPLRLLLPLPLSN